MTLTADELRGIARASALARGCCCDAEVTITQVEPGYRRVTVEHDGDCPALREVAS